MIRRFTTALLTTLALLACQIAAAADANQASAAELEAVKGIGPALSAKITTARQKGAFKDWPDLVDRVSGMGPNSAARLSQNGLTVAGAAYAPQAARAAKPTAKPDAKPAADAPTRKPAAKPAQG